MGERYWVLNGKTAVVGTGGVHEWGRMFDDSAARTVGRTELGEWFVSTVFLGINHNWGGGPPLLFETMIFSHHDPRNAQDEGCWRYTTWEQAEAGHAAIVAWLTADPDALRAAEMVGEALAR